MSDILLFLGIIVGLLLVIYFVMPRDLEKHLKGG